ncbi:MAG: CDC7 protein kinase [Amphiamblys sp. WSBS2006]|nr:MAG: CDC7 protein kinase [Amphiamblys sp. WSBS2006]
MEGQQSDFLVSERDREELQKMLLQNPQLCRKYIPVRKIGEGTFSKVYKALDKEFYSRDNSRWLDYTLQDDRDIDRLQTQLEQHGAENMKENLNAKRENLIETHLKKYVEGEKRPPHFVALKCITQTSSPTRILDEIKFLSETGGKQNVIPVIEAFRHEDSVIVVFPFFMHGDFRSYLPEMTIEDIALYMRQLFTSLKNIHSKGVIHRDVKPSNFAFCRKRGTGLLLDFGLAQQARGDTKDHELSHFVDRKVTTSHNPEDRRHPMRASRAGTRGFRAPEVLFKHAEQTTAVDIWSAGVVLLILLTRRYPFFCSYDDMDAIVEIACIFGTEEMRRAGFLYKRRWTSDLPTCPSKHVTWERLCSELCPEFAQTHPASAYDLLSKCLSLSMKERITAEAALEHPFIAEGSEFS